MVNDHQGTVLQTLSDSIAIEILDENTIITGKGNELHLFTKIQHEWKEKVLDIKLTNKIHGISGNTNTKDLIVVGEKEYVLIAYNESEGKFEEFFRASLTDWISCGSFLDDAQQLILLTAHSIILRFDYDVAKRTCTLVERISCSDDKSTLYCGHLYGKTWKELLVLAGNAFGELLIWQPSENTANLEGPMKPKLSSLIHRVAAHNGVIFSVDFDHDTKYLITTSDDRAVKWWKVSFAGDCSNWKDSKLQAVASGYGHVARVFKGRIIKEGSDIYALSVGEDSYFCLWRKNGELVFKRRQQFGATIWNFAYDLSNKAIYTIGSLGNLTGYSLDAILQQSHKETEKHILLPEVNQNNSTEYIAKIKFLNENHIVGITNENRLMRLTYQQDQNEDLTSWKFVDIGLDFKCTVMEVCANRLAICGFKRVLLLEWDEKEQTFEKLLDKQILQGVIRAFVFFTDEDYIICDDKGNCFLSMTAQFAEQTLKLPKCKEPWLTSALLINQKKQLLISNRQGNILLYKQEEQQNSFELCDTIKHPHGNLGATCLQLLHESPEKIFIRSSGHDGSIKIFAINKNTFSMKACSREIIPVAWVEDIQRGFVEQDLFLGFNDNHFVVWCREYDFLIQLACGGGHRCWHFIINPNDFQISLVFIKNKRVTFYRLALINKSQISLPPASKWHVAPCNIMQALRGIPESTTILVSAGDDNLIKIHTFAEQQLVFRAELHCHISNVRALQILSLNANDFLIFSGGGRAQLCITKVNKKHFRMEELINHTLKPESSNKLEQSKQQYNFDAETRLMSLDVRKIENNIYQIYIGCSDGYLRSLSFNLSTRQILQSMQYFYNRCILHVKYIPEFHYVLVAATDGIIKFFDCNLTTCLHKTQHHFGGVNSLSTMYDFKGKTLKILSGGDDQSVSYSELDLQNDFNLLGNSSRPSLHTAQVCATAISWNGHFGYTCGLDQILYKMEFYTGKIVDTFRSCIADVKGTCLVNEDICLLYGCGLQIYESKKIDKNVLLKA